MAQRTPKRLTRVSSLFPRPCVFKRWLRHTLHKFLWIMLIMREWKQNHLMQHWRTRIVLRKFNGGLGKTTVKIKHQRSRTSPNKRVNEQKNIWMAMLCTRVLYLGTFLSRPSANPDNVKWVSSMYFGKTKPGRLIFRIFLFGTDSCCYLFNLSRFLERYVY